MLEITKKWIRDQNKCTAHIYMRELMRYTCVCFIDDTPIHRYTDWQTHWHITQRTLYQHWAYTKTNDIWSVFLFIHIVIFVCGAHAVLILVARVCVFVYSVYLCVRCEWIRFLFCFCSAKFHYTQQNVCFQYNFMDWNAFTFSIFIHIETKWWIRITNRISFIYSYRIS